MFPVDFNISIWSLLFWSTFLTRFRRGPHDYPLRRQNGQNPFEDLTVRFKERKVRHVRYVLRVLTLILSSKDENTNPMQYTGIELKFYLSSRSIRTGIVFQTRKRDRPRPCSLVSELRLLSCAKTSEFPLSRYTVPTSTWKPDSRSTTVVPLLL